MTSPEVIFTICRRTTASPYHILKSLMGTAGSYLRFNLETVEIDPEHAQSDGKSVNRGFPLLDFPRDHDPWC